MTPDQLREQLARHIDRLEADIKRTEKFANLLSRQYLGGSGATNMYAIRAGLRRLQEWCTVDPSKAEHLAKVFSLPERGDLDA